MFASCWKNIRRKLMLFNDCSEVAVIISLPLTVDAAVLTLLRSW